LGVYNPELVATTTPIYRWKELLCGHDTVLKRWRHCYIWARKEAPNKKKLVLVLVREKTKKTPTIFWEGEGWVPWWEMVGDLNLCPHIQVEYQVELSRPSRELVIYF